MKQMLDDLRNSSVDEGSRWVTARILAAIFALIASVKGSRRSRPPARSVTPAQRPACELSAHDHDEISKKLNADADAAKSALEACNYQAVLLITSVATAYGKHAATRHMRAINRNRYNRAAALNKLDEFARADLLIQDILDAPDDQRYQQTHDRALHERGNAIAERQATLLEYTDEDLEQTLEGVEIAYRSWQTTVRGEIHVPLVLMKHVETLTRFDHPALAEAVMVEANKMLSMVPRDVVESFSRSDIERRFPLLTVDWVKFVKAMPAFSRLAAFALIVAGSQWITIAKAVAETMGG